MKSPRRIGPGLLVTAAFIGPGTVTTASRAGADYGFALVWAVLYSIVATIVLQEMAARLGLVGRQGLGEAIRATVGRPAFRLIACAFVIAAIGCGNAAYQTGNLTGAARALHFMTNWPTEDWAVLLAVAAFALLLSGTYKLIERVLIALVVVMSAVFVLTALVVLPQMQAPTIEMFVPRWTTQTSITTIALIGTTVVPYNLFLHANAVREKWPESIPVEQALDESRRDTALSISVGGVITLAIITTAAATFFGKGGFAGLANVATQLEPLMGGSAASVAFALGLFAAGLTSTITAPLAAAYAVSGVLGWERDLHSWRFRLVWTIVLLAGSVFALIYGESPAETIILAQFANGLLLPVIAVFLLVVVNRSAIMGAHKNGTISNVLGVIVVLTATGLGLWNIAKQIASLLDIEL